MNLWNNAFVRKRTEAQDERVKAGTQEEQAAILSSHGGLKLPLKPGRHEQYTKSDCQRDPAAGFLVFWVEERVQKEPRPAPIAYH